MNRCENEFSISQGNFASAAFRRSLFRTSSSAPQCWASCGTRSCCLVVCSREWKDRIRMLSLLPWDQGRRWPTGRMRGLTAESVYIQRSTFHSSTPFSPTNCSTFAEATCEPARCRRLCRVCGGFIRRCGFPTAGCREKPNAVATNRSSQNSAAHPVNTPAAC